MSKNESNAQSKIATARPNIIILLTFLVFYLSFNGFIPSLTILIFDGVANDMVLNMLRGLEISSLLLLLYFLITKRSSKSVLSISPLGLKNGWYVAVMSIVLFLIAYISMLSLMLFIDTATDSIFFQEAMRWRLSSTFWLSIFTVGLLMIPIKELLLRVAVYDEYRKQGVDIKKITIMVGTFYGLVLSGLILSEPGNIIFNVGWGIWATYALHYTSSIWAPILARIIFDSLMRLLNPVYHVDSYVELRNILATYLIIAGVVLLVLIPVASICWKKLIVNNPLPEGESAVESKAFTNSFWAVITVMVVLTVLI